MSVRATIVSIFQQVAADQSRTLAPLVDTLPLAESGLDSLSFAIVVTMLEESLGTDPFSSESWVEFPTTFGDFVALYEGASA